MLGQYHAEVCMEAKNATNICVGRRRWVLERTISRSSCDVGTGAISFHVNFIFAVVPWVEVVGEEKW